MTTTAKPGRSVTCAGAPGFTVNHSVSTSRSSGTLMTIGAGPARRPKKTWKDACPSLIKLTPPLGPPPASRTYMPRFPSGVPAGVPAMLTVTSLLSLPDESLISITIGLLGPASIVSVRLMSEIMRIRGTFLGPPMSTTQAAVLVNTRHRTIQRGIIGSYAPHLGERSAEKGDLRARRADLCGSIIAHGAERVAPTFVPGPSFEIGSPIGASS